MQTSDVAMILPSFEPMKVPNETIVQTSMYSSTVHL